MRYVAAIILSIVALPNLQRAATLGTAVMSNQPPVLSNCAVPFAVTTILLTDPNMTFWMSVNNAALGDRVHYDWFSPSGIYKSSDYTANISGNICVTSTYTVDNSLKPLVGNWTVKATYNGAPFAQASFTLVDTGAHLPRTLSSAVITRSSTVPTCSPPEPVTSFVDTDAAMNVWYSFTNGYAGQVTSIDWFDPSGRFVTTVKTSPLPSDGSFCSIVSLPLDSTRNHLFGNWTASASYDGNSFFTITVPLNDSRLLNVPYQLTVNQFQADSCPAYTMLVSVQDKLGNPVTGLTSADFKLTESGSGDIPVTVTPVQGTNSGLSLAIVIDSSGSLSDSDLSLEKTAAKQLIGMLDPRDSAGVWSFTEKVVQQTGFTTDRTAAQAAVDRISDRGGTAIYDAIVAATQALTLQPKRRAIVLMTDGDDNSSSASLSQAISTALGAHTPVFTVGFGARNDQVLTQIASQTGAFYSATSNSADLQRILYTLGKALVNQYQVTYTSKNSSVVENATLSVQNSSGKSNPFTITNIQPCTAGPPHTGTIDAKPNPIVLDPGKTSGQTQLTWTTTNVTAVVIREGSPTGGSITGGTLPANGSTFTNDSTTEGTVFYLIDASDPANETVLSKVTVHAVATSGPATLIADPSPVTFCSDPATARSRLSWSAPGFDSITLRWGNSSPGLPVASGGATGGTFANITSPPMRFFITDAQSNVLAERTVNVNCEVPQTISAPNGFVGQTYSFRPVLTAGKGPYLWQVSLVQLITTPVPAGLTLEDDGTIHGVPQTTTADVYHLRLTAQDTGTTGMPSAEVDVQIKILPAQSGGPATMTSPSPGATFAGSTVTFSWTAVDGASEYVLGIGRTTDATDLYFHGQGLQTSATVNNLPSDGSVLYVKLWTHVGDSWLSNLYTYRASTTSGGPQSVILSPAPNSTLSSGTVTFTWQAVSGSSEYVLGIGRKTDANDVYFKGQGLQTSATVSNLPTDGSTLYVKIWTHLGNNWLSSNYSYHASSTPGGPQSTIVTPTPGSTFSSGTVSFTWTAVNGSSEYVLGIGRNTDATDVYFSGQGLHTSATVSNLPTDGSAISVKIWTHLASGWLSSNYTYHASSTPGGPQSTIINPTPGSTFSGTTVTFTWTAVNGSSEYVLGVGRTTDANDIYFNGQGLRTSGTVSNLPTDGSTLYVKIWTHLASGWLSSNYTYKASP